MESEIKLEQYVLLAKGVRGRAIADLIAKVASEPGIFVFGELLDVPSIKELQGSEFQQAYDLLQLFCYGAWQDYKAAESNLPQLSEQQVLKLKQLTVVSLAASSKTLSYKCLMSELDIGNIRELEDLLISECFYAGIIHGKLDQREQVLQVHECASRDVRPEELPGIIGGLSSWLGVTHGVMEQLEERIHSAQQASESAARHQEDLKAQTEAVRKSLSKAESEERAGQDAMLIDDHLGTMDVMDMEDRSGPSSSRPKRRR